MAYATSNPPRILVDSIGGLGPRIWTYQSTDAAAVVDGANYITNGGSLGLKVGDVVFVLNTTGNISTLHQVSATGDGTTDLNDLTTITQTDSD